MTTAKDIIHLYLGRECWKDGERQAALLALSKQREEMEKEIKELRIALVTRDGNLTSKILKQENEQLKAELSQWHEYRQVAHLVKIEEMKTYKMERPSDEPGVILGMEYGFKVPDVKEEQSKRKLAMDELIVELEQFIEEHKDTPMKGIAIGVNAAIQFAKTLRVKEEENIKSGYWAGIEGYMEEGKGAEKRF